jgi:hypothetical protein
MAKGRPATVLASVDWFDRDGERHTLTAVVRRRFWSSSLMQLVPYGRATAWDSFRIERSPA